MYGCWSPFNADLSLCWCVVFASKKWHEISGWRECGDRLPIHFTNLTIEDFYCTNSKLPKWENFDFFCQIATDSKLSIQKLGFFLRNVMFFGNFLGEKD